jgi:hypothetical protein
LISLGGQALRVLSAHMWALNTCGEPTKIELTIRVLTDSFAAPFQAWPAYSVARRSRRYVNCLAANRFDKTLFTPSVLEYTFFRWQFGVV